MEKCQHIASGSTKSLLKSVGVVPSSSKVYSLTLIEVDLEAWMSFTTNEFSSRRDSPTLSFASRPSGSTKGIPQRHNKNNKQIFCQARRIKGTLLDYVL